jgi:Tol biopolymer transport system component
VLVREFADGQRALVAYDFSTGSSRRLADLSRDENPTVSPDGTQVVLVRANGPWRDPRDQRWLAKSGSHLVLIDLVDGTETALTDIPSGQRVGSPQWNRSDGWIYFLGPVGRSATGGLVRLNPETMQREPVPNGRGVGRFILEPDGTHALISVSDVWCRTVQLPVDECETPHEWRLDLGTGSFRSHPVQAFEADVAWTPTGSRLAATQGGGGAGLYVTNQPSSWFRSRNLLYAAVWELPSSITHFTGVAWEPDGSHVVLGSREGRIQRFSPVFDRWYVSLIDRRTGERTDLTPRGVADTSFDVWWPEG